MRGSWVYIIFLITGFLLLTVAVIQNTSFEGLKKLVSQDATLTVWPPSQVETEKVPITFTYSQKTDDPITVTVLAKPSTDETFVVQHKETIDVPTLSSGKPITVLWHKGPSLNQQLYDIRLSIEEADGDQEYYDIHQLHFRPKEDIRNHIDNYAIYYGPWNDRKIKFAYEHYQMVILDTRSGITAEQIARLRSGKDPHDARDDVLVIGYESIGEDLRTAGLSPEEMRTQNKFVLDGSGPSVDPREGAPYPNSGPFTDSIPLVGKPTKGGFAPYYLNDNYVANGTGSRNVPDMNANFKAAFVNPGHPLWLEALQSMTLETDGIPGIHELLTSHLANGYACDGLFLDTLDTAAPNYYTSPESWNQGEFEWVAPGTQHLIRTISELYPDKFLVANRGLFFFNPDLPMFSYTLRPYVDFVMFESFRLDSNTTQNFHAGYYLDNKFNYAQKLLAEADREDGFRVLSLGYAEGSDGQDMKQALQGLGNAEGIRLLKEDIAEANGELGMIHYISDGNVESLNNFYYLHRKSKSTSTPIWGSTASGSANIAEFEPRIGIQAVEARDGNVYVKWDVAHAQARPVKYTLYVKSGSPFHQGQEPEEQSDVLIMDLPKTMPANYPTLGSLSKRRYPYEAKVEGLNLNKNYYFLIRAVDANGVMDDNYKSILWEAQPTNSPNS